MDWGYFATLFPSLILIITSPVAAENVQFKIYEPWHTIWTRVTLKELKARVSYRLPTPTPPPPHESWWYSRQNHRVNVDESVIHPVVVPPHPVTGCTSERETGTPSSCESHGASHCGSLESQECKEIYPMQLSQTKITIHTHTHSTVHMQVSITHREEVD